MNFSFIVHVPIPNLKGTNRHVRRLAAPLLAFSTDGTKFAASMNDGAVSVCDVRRKIPLKVFEVDVPRHIGPFLFTPLLQFLQFSSGLLGREVLAFIAEVSRYFYLELLNYLSKKWLLERKFFFNWSENHPFDWRNIVWDGRNSLLTCNR